MVCKIHQFSAEGATDNKVCVCTQFEPYFMKQQNAVIKKWYASCWITEPILAFQVRHPCHGRDKYRTGERVPD
jgi:hypothetical protein